MSSGGRWTGQAGPSPQWRIAQPRVRKEGRSGAGRSVGNLDSVAPGEEAGHRRAGTGGCTRVRARNRPVCRSRVVDPCLLGTSLCLGVEVPSEKSGGAPALRGWSVPLIVVRVARFMSGAGVCM